MVLVHAAIAQTAADVLDKDTSPEDARAALSKWLNCLVAAACVVRSFSERIGDAALCERIVRTRSTGELMDLEKPLDDDGSPL
jgi:hypothetical protein